MLIQGSFGWEVEWGMRAAQYPGNSGRGGIRVCSQYSLTPACGHTAPGPGPPAAGINLPKPPHEQLWHAICWCGTRSHISSRAVIPPACPTKGSSWKGECIWLSILKIVLETEKVRKHLLCIISNKLYSGWLFPKIY